MVANIFSRFAVALVTGFAACVAIAGVANAQANSVTLTLDSNTGSPVNDAGAGSSFHMNFLLDDPHRMNASPIGTTRDLEISLTSPNNSVFRFMFSPRPQFGIGFDPISGTNRAYAGLTWNLFSADSLYGHFGLAGSFDPAIGGVDLRRGDEAPLMFHGALEFGYRLDQQNNLLFAIDQSVAPGAHGPGPESADNFMFRFGRKF
jgi:hypothetical protein